MDHKHIVIADEHTRVRQQLVHRLKREPDFVVVGEASNSAQTLNFVRSTTPDILLIDPMMSDGQGLATLRKIIRDLPQTAIVVLTAVIDTALRMTLTDLGVKHILSKELNPMELIGTLKQATEREKTT